jgi:methylamine dehydrogenase accessory protein MauD
MSTGWIISNIVLWLVVVCETGLLLLLLRAIGELRQQGILPTVDKDGANTGGLAVGEQAPTFIATDYASNEVSLEDFRGMQRILAFVSPGCPACANTIEALNALIQTRQDVKVLVVGGPNREHNQRFAVEYKAKMPILTASPTLLSETYHISGVPFIFAIDESGIILAKKVVNNSQHMQALIATAFPSTVQPSYSV